MSEGSSAMRVGILTGGGDAPGLNAAICGVWRRLQDVEAVLVPFRDGWGGVIEDRVVHLDPRHMHELVTRGGTILGSSSANPYRDPGRDVPRVKATFARRRLDALVAIGGEGTLLAAERLHREEGLPLVGVPKTIDNDLSATDFTFGFFTAVDRAMTMIDQLRTTADSHHRVMVVECMGRHAGWITAYAGVAAGAEVILVPERPVELNEVFQRLRTLRATGKESAVVAVAEGCRILEDDRLLSSDEKDEYGCYKVGGAGEMVARRIQHALGWEARAIVLGHLQRSGPPGAFDRIFALRLGAKAARLVMERRFGRMSALRNGDVTDVALSEAVGERKVLSPTFIDRYQDFFLVPALSP